MKVVVLGKDFAATVVHVSFEKNKVDGQAVDSVWLDPTSYPVASIKIGAAYDVDRDSRGFVVGFEPVG